MALLTSPALLNEPLFPPLAGTRLATVQVPELAPLPTLAPVNGIAAGLADWHAVVGPPASTVGGELIVIVLVSDAKGQAPGVFDVNVSVTTPE